MAKNISKILQIFQFIEKNNADNDLLREYIIYNKDSFNEIKPQEIQFLNNKPLKDNRNIELLDFEEKYDNVKKEYFGTMRIKLNDSSNDYYKAIIRQIKRSSREIIGKKFDYNNFNTTIHYKQDVNYINEYSNISALGFKVDYNYNFLVKQYEEYLLKNEVDELNLPNFYEFLEAATRENITDEISLPEEVSQRLRDPNIFNTPEFFIDTNDTRDDLKSIIFNSKIGNKTLEKYLNYFNGFKEQFPMFTEIHITPNEKSSNSFSVLFDKKNIFDTIFDSGLELENQKVSYVSKILDPLENNEERIIISKYNNFIFAENFLTKLLQSDYLNFIDLYEIEGKIDYYRNTMDRILNNENCYSETIGYRIKKFKNDSIASLQEWIVPNVFEEIIKIVDTQVKYDTNYRYSIEPIVMVLGTQYRYGNIDLYDEDGSTYLNIEYNYRNVPRIFFLEEPETSLINRILDTPPIKPEINFYPLIGIDNKIKIFINSGIGNYYDTALPFNELEIQKLNDITNFQKSNPTFNVKRNDTKILFSSDDIPKTFEIYRLDTKPESYDDFIRNFPNSLIKQIDVTLLNATSAEFTDSIKPNTKYWYFARAIDYHGNFSNPTHVFQIENVNIDGTIFPIIQFYEFSKNNEQTTTLKAFKRFIKIEPSIQQLETVEAKNGNFSFQNTIDSIWGKRFKITLTSKSTGKKVDFYFVYTQDGPRPINIVAEAARGRIGQII